MSLQLDILDDAVFAARPSRTCELAALTLQWHATYWPEAFTPVADRCDSLVTRARSDGAWNYRGYLRCAPLLLSLALSYDLGRLTHVPEEIVQNLWHDQSGIRTWMMESVFWSSPRLPADAFAWAYEESTKQRHLYRDWFALIIAMCANGVRTLDELHERLPDDETLAEVVNKRRLDDAIENPFSSWGAALYAYMFQQCARLEGARDDWNLSAPDASVARNREILWTFAVDDRWKVLSREHLDFRSIEGGHRLDDEVRVLGQPVKVGDSTYRLVLYEGEEVGVQEQHTANIWLDPGEAPTVAEIIRHMFP